MLDHLKQYFLGLDSCSYLYTGAESPSLASNLESLSRYLIDKSLGEIGRKKAADIEVQAKSNIAQLINASPEEIAFLGNASEAINSVVSMVRMNPGDNVVVNDLEYASVTLPWIRLKKELGIEVRIARSQNGVIPGQHILNLIDEKTCLVAVSHVSYLNGFRHNLQNIRQITLDKQVPLLVDATQSLGVVPVDSKYFDILVSSSYKWILGTHGIGILYVDKAFQEKLQPNRIGWRSVKTIFSEDRWESFELRADAGKYEVGFSNYPGIYALENSSRFLLNIGIEKIEQHVLNLGNHLVEGLREQGWQIMSPEKRNDRSGNISFRSNECETIMNFLESQNIKVWGGDGRVRVSIHLFNDIDDINHLLESLLFFKKNQ